MKLWHKVCTVHSCLPINTNDASKVPTLRLLDFRRPAVGKLGGGGASRDCDRRPVVQSRGGGAQRGTASASDGGGGADKGEGTPPPPPKVTRVGGAGGTRLSRESELGYGCCRYSSAYSEIALFETCHMACLIDKVCVHPPMQCITIF